MFYLGDRLWSGFVVGFTLTAPPCLVEDLLHFFVILHLEVFCPIVELMESPCPPDVLHGGDKGQVGAGLLVVCLHQVSPGGARFALSSGPLVGKEDGLNEERHDRP